MLVEKRHLSGMPHTRKVASAFLQRNRQNFIYMLCFIGAMIILWSWNPAYGVSAEQKLSGRVWLIIGTGLIYAAFLTQRTIPGLVPAPLIFSRFRYDWIPYWAVVVYGGGMLILLGFWANPNYRLLGLRPPIHSWLPNYYQLLLLFGGMFLWVVGFMSVDDGRRIVGRVRESWRKDRWEWLAVGILTAAALGVRLYRLVDAAPIMLSDETAYLAAARRVLEGEIVTIASDMHRGDLFLGAYLISIIIHFFGASLFTGRLLVAIVGALAIPGVYLMARRLFNWQAGLLAGMFLLAQPLHTHFSRIALYDIYDPTFGIFAVLLLWDGIERGGYWKFALAGVLIGFSLYFYAGAKLWVILIPMWLVVMFLRRPRVMLSYWLPMLIMVVSVVLLLFPMIAHFSSRNIDPFSHVETMGRGAENGVLGVFDNWTLEEFLFERLSPSVRAFVDKGDVTRHFEPIGKVALNLRWALLAFAIGIAYYLRHPLNDGLLFVMMWIGLTVLLGGALMEDTPGFSRYVTATLPMAVIAGLGVAAFANIFRTLLPAHRQQVIIVPAIALMLIVNVNDFRYVQEQMPKDRMKEIFLSRLVNGAVVTDAYELTREGKKVYFLLSGDADRYRLYENYVYLCGFCGFNEFNLLRFDPNQISYTWLTEVWLSTLDTSQEFYLFVLPELDDPYDLSQPLSPKSPVHIIQAAFPEAEIVRYNSSRYDSPRKFGLYTRVYVPAGATYCPPGSACRAASP